MSHVDGMEELLPLATLARLIGMSRYTLSQAAREGRVAAVRRGHYWYVSLAAVIDAAVAGTMLLPESLGATLFDKEDTDVLDA